MREDKKGETIHDGAISLPKDIGISGKFIPLGSFLKWAHFANSGGEAKHLVQSGCVLVNGHVETRRRRMLGLGDVVDLPGGLKLRVFGEGFGH